MTTSITAKTCEAWFLLEAADMRGLPAPFVVRVTQHRTTELGLKTGEEFDRWVEALAVDPVTNDVGGLVQRTASGELHEMAVSVFVCETAGVSA